MMRFVVGYDRSQISLFPERLGDYLDEEECRAFTLRETSGEGSTAARLDAAHVVTLVPVIKGTQTDAEGGSSSRLSLFATRTTSISSDSDHRLARVKAVNQASLLSTYRPSCRS
jgi:hypothetical protein